MTVPYTARCPECDAVRTFTIIGPRMITGDRMVGCVVCGTTEREALQRASLDPELTIASQVKVINYMASQLDAMTQQLAERQDQTRNVTDRQCSGCENIGGCPGDCGDDLAALRDELHAHVSNRHTHGG